MTCILPESMSTRWSNTGLIVAAVIVALLLGALAFYPGVLAPGYNTNVEDYEQSIEAGPSENVTSEVELEAGTNLEQITYRYEELSPSAQELFDRTRTADSATYTPDICLEHVLVCNGYHQEDLPPEFTYGAGLDDASLYTVIEYGGDQYLLRTGVEYTANTANLLYGLLWLFFRGLLLFHAAIIVTTTLLRLSQRINTNAQLYAILIAGGALTGTVGFLIPYIEMAGLVSGRGNVFRLVTIVTLGYAVAVFAWLIAAVTQQ